MTDATDETARTSCASPAERLAALLDALDAADGPLPDDPVEDERLGRLLGAGASEA